MAHSYTEELDKTHVLKKGVGRTATPVGEFACAWLAATGAVLELDESLDVDADDDEVELDDLEGALAFDDDCLVLTLIPTSA